MVFFELLSAPPEFFFFDLQSQEFLLKRGQFPCELFLGNLLLAETSLTDDLESFVEAGLVHDLCLTTSPLNGGMPNTPFYAGDRPPRLELIVRKRGTGESAIAFEQFAIVDV